MIKTASRLMAKKTFIVKACWLYQQNEGGGGMAKQKLTSLELKAKHWCSVDMRANINKKIYKKIYIKEKLMKIVQRKCVVEMKL